MNLHYWSPDCRVLQPVIRWEMNQFLNINIRQLLLRQPELSLDWGMLPCLPWPLLRAFLYQILVQLLAMLPLSLLKNYHRKQNLVVHRGLLFRNTPLSQDRPTFLNEYGMCISPDEHSIIEDPLLRCTPYIVNRKYMTLICTDCGHCINPEKASQHLRKHHGHCKVGVDFLAQLNTKFTGLVVEEICPLQVIDPVFGLAIPIDMYTICTRCGRGYANLATWCHHACSKKDVNLEGRPDHFPSLVQTFFRGPNICYFPVKLPVSVLDKAPGDNFNLFKSAFWDLPVFEDVIDEPEDYRELNQFLAKEGWINHVSGHSRSELLPLTAPLSEEEVLKPVIARDIIAVMLKIQSAIGKAGYYARRLLGKCPS